MTFVIINNIIIFIIRHIIIKLRSIKIIIIIIININITISSIINITIIIIIKIIIFIIKIFSEFNIIAHISNLVNDIFSTF